MGDVPCPGILTSFWTVDESHIFRLFSGSSHMFLASLFWQERKPFLTSESDTMHTIKRQCEMWPRTISYHQGGCLQAFEIEPFQPYQKSTKIWLKGYAKTVLKILILISLKPLSPKMHVSYGSGCQAKLMYPCYVFSWFFTKPPLNHHFSRSSEYSGWAYLSHMFCLHWIQP